MEHKKKQINQQREAIVFSVYECIRDASSTENIRAIQDSEGQVSQEQKRMVKMLVAQGWSKNEIIYEIQRVFGNDVLILTNKLDDERGLFGRTMPFVSLGLAGAFFMLTRRSNALRNVPTKSTS